MEPSCSDEGKDEFVFNLILNVHFHFVILFSWRTCKLAGASRSLCLSSLWDALLPYVAVRPSKIN